jgi:hypothetical protein
MPTQLKARNLLALTMLKKLAFLFNLVYFSTATTGRNGNCNPQCNTTACGFDERDCIPACPAECELQVSVTGSAAHCVTLRLPL